MFVGHFAVAFAAKPAAPRASLATLIVAAGLADILWIVFFVTGVERVEIVPGLMPANSLDLVSVPFSHSCKPSPSSTPCSSPSCSRGRRG